jgi:hypothetical protein
MFSSATIFTPQLFHPVNHVGPQRLSGESDRRSNSCGGQPRVLGYDLLDGFSCRKLFQDQFNRDTGAGHRGFPIMTLGSELIRLSGILEA